MKSTERMAICMLATSFPRFAGDLFGNFIDELARQLSASGTEVTVVAPHQAGCARKERRQGVWIRRFRYFLPHRYQCLAYGDGIPTNLRRSLLARLQLPLFLLGFLWRALRETRGCHVIHCHWTVTGLIGALCGRWRRLPVVLSVRGSDLNLFDRGLARRLNRLIFDLVDAVVTVSDEMRERIIESGVEATKVTLIANGVGERFAPGDRDAARLRLGLPADGTIAGFVGMLAPVKGVDVLVEALSTTRGPEVSAVLVGEGTLRPEIEGWVRDHDLTARFRLVGQRPAEEIPAWLCAFDFLVLPSHSEGRPNVVLEALSCGTPVIASRVGGVPELIVDGATGILVEAGDAVELARAIERLAADADLRHAMGAAGRRWIQEQGLTWPACAEAFRTLYAANIAQKDTHSLCAA